MKKSLMSLFCVAALATLPACWGDKKPCCGASCEETTTTETKTVEEMPATEQSTEAAAPAEVTATETVETTEEVK